MKKGISTLLAIASTVIILSISSCYNEAQERVPTSNIEFSVSKIFTVDSCDVYRFFDGGYAIYFTSCKGNTFYYTGGKHNRIVESINETN